VRLAIVGDFDSANPNHPATEKAVAHALDATGKEAQTSWVPTTALERDPATLLDGVAGVFLTTGSPYRSLEGALAGIRQARLTGLPFLGTCGGFQHVVVEAFRNVAGIADAAHGEYDVDTANHVITPLACSLAGQTMSVHLAAGSLVADAYGTTTAAERYFCQFGLATEYRDRLDETGLVPSGTDDDGEVRVLELRAHPFFLATLYVPQATSTPTHPHPVIKAFINAAAAED